MTQATVTAALLLALVTWCATPTLAGDRDGPQRSGQRHSGGFTADKMFVGNRDSHEVDVYDLDGNWIFGFGGLSVPFGMDVDEGDLYVVSQGTHEVYVYRDHGNASREHKAPRLKLLVEAHSGGLERPFYSTVADDMLYVSSYDTDQVLRYDAETGAFLGVAVAAGAGGLDGPRGLDFDSSGRLYVSSSVNDRVIVYSRHGEPVGDLVTGYPTPCGISISRYDEICVGSAGGSGVHCYDPEGHEIYSDIDGGVCGLDFGPRGELYTTRGDLQAVTVHSLHPDTHGEWFTDAALPSGLSWGE